MVLIGAISIVRGVLLFITQIIAGICAAALVRVLFKGDLAVSTTLGGGTTIAQGVIIEMILTAQLVFTIFMLAAEKHQGNFIAPVGIGLSLFISELTGQCNSFSPDLVAAQFDSLILQFFPVLVSLTLFFPCRCLLDRWIIESSPVFRTGSRDPRVPFHTVDILGWTTGRVYTGCYHLQDY